jgi:transporter family-2 protein
MAIGVLISFMLLANGALQATYGPAVSLLIIHATGALVLLGILKLRRASFKMQERVPLYLFSAGALGVLLVFLNNLTVASLGLTLTIALGVVGQLCVSGVIDHYGLFGLSRRPVNPKKLAGLLLILAGIAVMAGGRV